MDLKVLESMNPAERDTYQQLLEQQKLHQLEVKDVRVAMTNMKNAVALELARTPYAEEDKIRKLQARIENYIALEMIFEAPEKAEEALKQALKRVENTIKR